MGKHVYNSLFLRQLARFPGGNGRARTRSRSAHGRPLLQRTGRAGGSRLRPRPNGSPALRLAGAAGQSRHRRARRTPTPRSVRKRQAARTMGWIIRQGPLLPRSRRMAARRYRQRAAGEWPGRGTYPGRLPRTNPTGGRRAPGRPLSAQAVVPRRSGKRRTGGSLRAARTTRPLAALSRGRRGALRRLRPPAWLPPLARGLAPSTRRSSGVPLPPSSTRARRGRSKYRPAPRWLPRVALRERRPFTSFRRAIPARQHEPDLTNWTSAHGTTTNLPPRPLDRST